MSALSTRPAAVTMNIRQRTQGWLSPLNLHWAGVAFLGLVCLYLLVRMAIAYQSASSQDANALANERVALQAASIAAKPLTGLDAKLKTASAAADAFSLDRLPDSYSEVATEIGTLAKKDNVRLTRAQYSPSPVDGDAAGQLTQVQVDAGLSGDYRGLMLFINGLERDRVFFLISGVTLTGQQTGVVNLRIRIVTYLRGMGSAEEMAAAQITPPADTTAAAPASAPAGGTR